MMTLLKSTAGVLIAAALSILLFSGCATRSAKTMDLSMVKKAPSGLLMNYELVGDTSLIRSGTCRLKLLNANKNQEIFVPLKKDETVLFAELPPGRYFGHRISCAVTKIWDLEGLFGPGVVVENGKISYAGKIIFEFSATDLVSYKHASRGESLIGLRQAFMKLPPALHGSVVSGFTGKAATPQLANAEGPEGFEVFAKGAANGEKVLNDLLTRLKECSASAAKQDPVRLGHLRYVAQYKDGAFIKMLEKSDAHALSDAFQTCIDNALRTFGPPLKDELEVQTKY